MDDFEFENERAWYVVQSYSGMEQAAKRNLERRIVSMNMQDYIFRVLIPETTRYEKKKNGEMKEIVEKVFPGYIFVDMIVTDESWFVVRNTPMVTGFLGSSGGGAKPVPLPNEEIIPILRTCGITVEFNIDFKVGDQVNVVSGPFAGQVVTVDSIDMENQKVTVLVDFFGRQTPQELTFDEIKAIK
ncbi:MAG: transcription termination/antitermination protein NusG [Bacilli bacterium]|nr:transcription termination/antitermination protein NusG [Bacilli bacterium]MDY4052045.1 transcription termination/antitermination protein NusG [Bacilli bacterium]